MGATFFLRYVHGIGSLQAAIDAPAFHSEHMPGSFWPRGAGPGRIVTESGFREEVVAKLRQRGHDVLLSSEWSLGRLAAVLADAGTEGWLRAAANTRGMQGYANTW